MPRIDACVRHRDVDLRKNLCCARNAQRLVGDNLACNLVVKPWRHAQVHHPIIGPVDADSFLFGGTAASVGRAICDDLVIIGLVAGIAKQVRGTMSGIGCQRLVRIAGETLHIAPCQTEAWLSRSERIGAVLAIDRRKRPAVASA